MTNETIGLTTLEASRELRVHPNTLLRWVKEGRVAAVRLGGRKLLFSRKELEKLISNRNSQTLPKG
jgi:excisionase family DNA binding protein